MGRKFKISQSDANVIREYALAIHGLAKARIEIGVRINTDNHEIQPNANVLLVTRIDNDDWEDTDLHDKMDWSDFRNGVELTYSGHGAFDFWVYSLGYHGELEGQVQAYFEPRAGGVTVLARLEANGLNVVKQ